MTWLYDSTIELRGKTYHVWTGDHKEGFVAYTLTHQPDPSLGIDYVTPKPTSGFWAGLEAFNDYITRMKPLNLPAGIPITACATMEESMAADLELAKELAEDDMNHTLAAGNKVTCVDDKGPIDIEDKDNPKAPKRKGIVCEEIQAGEIYTIKSVVEDLVMLIEVPTRWWQARRFINC